METLAQLAPLLIFIPAIGALINFFWGHSLGERTSALIGSMAAAMTFLVALALFAYLGNNNYEAAIIDFPFFDTWIRIDSINLEFAWQQRVDTLSVTMMLFVSFVGTLIHIYAAGYMHGDPRFARFFGYLNMFLFFMLILVSGNNFLMMFVGWEGVGLCSYLLIGFWWDKPKGVGWKNGNAARKAFIVNRIGDFGVLMAMFLIFWTFGTLDFYKPGEITNPTAGMHHGEEAEHSEETGAVAEEGEHGENEEHGSAVAAFLTPENAEPHQLGIFGQTQQLVNLQKATDEDIEIDLGNFTLNLETLLVLITMFLLLGATGKSAQIPLFVWLPDAMAGPTPVSALIHAATMVTAGVYMMVRSNVLFYNAELTSLIVTIVGAGTAIVAGFIAIAQFDIKRVLAYSTVSQLGFMVAAVGVGAYPAAIFHMVTHAFFKALLFLGSGSVIHGVEHGHHHVHHHGHDDDHHEEEFDPQDMRNMGGLRKKMPITYWTYVIATLALAGIFPFAGFWSKDEILADAWQVGFQDGELRGYIALLVLLPAAAMTAFYMWRQVAMVFHGQPRTDAADHASESVPSMTIPLMVLAFFSVFIGFINTPSNIFFFSDFFGEHHLGNWLEYSIVNFHLPPFNLLIALTALALGLGAIVLAGRIYGNNRAINAEGKDPLQADPSISTAWAFANGRLYWDEFYYTFVERPFNWLADFLANIIDWMFLHDYFHNSVLYRGYKSLGELLAQPFDLGLIDGVVNGIGRVVQQMSVVMRRVQTGYVRTYAVAFLLGVVTVVVLMLLPLID
jgi:NADH-quinone oxidoreductase subunit L